MFTVLFQLFTQNAPKSPVEALERSNAPPLPNELILHIVSFTRDRKTLNACSLVCRNWLPMMRSILFKHIVLCLSKDILHVLDSKLARLSEYVDGVTALTLKRRDSFLAEQKLSLKTLLTIVNRFPNLIKVEIFRLSLLHDQPSSMDDSPHTSLRTIQLVYSKLLSPREAHVPINVLCVLFTSFPSLEDLVLRQTYTEHGNYIGSQFDRQVTPSLRTLSIHTCLNLAYLLPVFRAITSWSLDTIDYTGTNTFFENLIFLCEIQGNARSLKTLRFSVPMKNHMLNHPPDVTDEGTCPLRSNHCD